MPKPISMCLVMTLTLAASDQLKPISTTRYNHAVSAKTDRSDIVIAAREMLVDITYADGRPRKGALLILFDSSSGRYLWEFGSVLLSEQASRMSSGYGTVGFAYVANDRMVLFAFGHPNLIVHESFGKANGIEDAEAKSLTEATGGLLAKLTGRTDDRILLNLGKLLPHEFFMACPTCSGPAPGKVGDITHKGSIWEEILQGPWKEKITLTEKYEIKDLTRLP